MYQIQRLINLAANWREEQSPETHQIILKETLERTSVLSSFNAMPEGVYSSSKEKVLNT